jgi:hypothetical protein
MNDFIMKIYDSLSGNAVGDPLIDGMTFQEKWNAILESMLQQYEIEKIDVEYKPDNIEIGSYGSKFSIAGRNKITLTLHLR